MPEVAILAQSAGTAEIKVMTYRLNHVSRGNDNDPANELCIPPGVGELEKLWMSMVGLLGNPGRVEDNLSLITELIRSEAPDVLLLQEADRSMPESLWIDAAARIAGETGYPHAVWGPKWSMHCGLGYVTGNAVLSKYPILEADNVALNPIDWKHAHRKLFGVHSALSVVIDVGGEPYRFVNTHLYSRKHGNGKKAEQVKNLLEMVAVPRSR